MSENKVGLGLFAEENMSTGGFDGGRAKIVQSRVKQTQPDPNKPGREPMWILSIKDATGQDHDIRYGLGRESDKRFAIIDGGKRFEGRAGAMMNKSCKAALLAKSLSAADFSWPKAALPKKEGQSPDVSALDGLTVEFENTAMEVGDKILADRKAKGQGAPTVLLIKAVVDGAAGEAEPEAEGGEGGEVDQAAILASFVEVVKGELAGGPLAIDALKTEVLKAVEGDETLSGYADDLMALLEDEDNLTSEEFGLEVADGKDAKGKKAKVVSDPNAKPKAKGGLKLGKR